MNILYFSHELLILFLLLTTENILCYWQTLLSIQLKQFKIPDHTVQLRRPEHLTKIVILANGTYCILRDRKIECTVPVGIKLPGRTDTGTTSSSRKDHSKKSPKNMSYAIFKWLKLRNSLENKITLGNAICISW